jgi:4-hydroxybenzoate polyprenyltransferase
MVKILKFIINEFLYNGHLQTLGALSIAIFSAILFKIKITWDLLLILYVNFYIIYLYNRHQEINIDYQTNKIRTEHLKLFNKYIPLLITALVTILIFLLIYFSNITSIFFIFSITILGFLYTNYFKKITKKIIAFKNIYVASVFSLLVIFPFIYYSLPFKNFLLNIIALMIFIFLRAILMQIFLDLKDIESDKQEGLLTLGVIAGREKTFKILQIGNLTTATFIPIIFWYLNIFSPSFLMLLFLAPINSYFLNLIKRGKLLGFILESGEFITLPILILFGNYLLL